MDHRARLQVARSHVTLAPPRVTDSRSPIGKGTVTVGAGAAKAVSHHWPFSLRDALSRIGEEASTARNAAASYMGRDQNAPPVEVHGWLTPVEVR